MYREKRGATHLVLYYRNSIVWQYPFEILDINLDTGDFHLVDGVLGRPGPGGTLYHPDYEKVFIGSSDPGYFMEFNPVTGEVGVFGPVADKGVQTAVIGKDGAIYLGECCQGQAERFDPASGQLESFGRMDPDYDLDINYQYTYTIGGDERYIYAGMGKIPFYLVIYDREQNSREIFFKDDNDADAAIVKSINGDFYYRRSSENAGTLWYLLENGQLQEIEPPPSDTLVEWYNRGNITREATEFVTEYGIEVNLDYSNPDSGNGNKVIISWREDGGTYWNEVEVTGFSLLPGNLKRLYPYGNNKFFGFMDFYGPVFIYDLEILTTTTLGRPLRSLYAALVEPDNDDIFLSGYPATTMYYDISQPWSLTRSVDINDPAINPHRFLLSGEGVSGKYHYYLARGADEKVYVGVQHERESTGASLGWYDPKTKESGGLRQPFENENISDLIAVDNGNKIVFSSKTMTGDTEGKLFVFDVNSGQIISNHVPIDGVLDAGKIIEFETNQIFGATGNIIYRYDIENNQLIYQIDLGKELFAGIRAFDQQMAMGCDGRIYVFADQDLLRVDPHDGSFETLLTSDPASIVFNHGDLYLYNGSSFSRVSGLLESR
jgi:hypothetical protein